MRISIVLAILTIAGVASADLTKDKERKDGDAKLAAQLADANRKCGTKLTATYDWKSEAKSPPSQTDLGPGSCAEAVRGLADLCDDSAEAKAAVQKQVKAVKCNFDAKVGEKKSGAHSTATDLAGTPPVPHSYFKFDKSTLTFAFDWNHSNTKDEAEKFMRKQL